LRAIDCDFRAGQFFRNSSLAFAILRFAMSLRPAVAARIDDNEPSSQPFRVRMRADRDGRLCL
jgi:hypothetical protein